MCVSRTNVWLHNLEKDWSYILQNVLYNPIFCILYEWKTKDILKYFNTSD